jgi:hypothetical protein
MCLSKPGIGLLVIFSAFIAAGCGELDTILSSKLSTNPVYRVTAAAEGRSLDDCAIVGIGSRIRPYFLDSIEDDPDITGLVVFLETPDGETVSRRVRYVPGSAAQVSDQPVETDTVTDGQILGDNAPEMPGGQTVSGEDAAGKNNSGTDVKISDSESGEYQTPANDGYAPDGNTFQEKNDAAEGRSSDSAGNPEKETVYQIREKKTFSGTGEIPDSDELVVHVSKLGAELPALLFPEKLAIGPYILVFQVLGLEGVLSQFEKFIYYVSDAKLALGDIQTYHSGNAERSGVVSPDTVLMLETKVSADERLAPYIVWYNGKKRLREGPVSDGLDRFLWRSPAQTGFQALRAEVFPFMPPPAHKNTGGLAKELSLAISSKQTRRAVGNAEAVPPDFVTRWYQFGGDLSDSLAPLDGGRELHPGDDTVVTWLPKTGIYGLAAGPGYSYTIPGTLFTPDKKSPGRGQLVFRFAVQSSGIVFSGNFALDRTSQTLKLDLSCDTDANCLILSRTLGDEKQEQILSLPVYARDEWITAAVDFAVENKEFRADLSLLSIGNGEFLTELTSLFDKNAPAGKGIVLPGDLTGEGVFRIGGGAAPANSSANTAAAAGKSGADATVYSGNTSMSTDTTAAKSAGNTPASFITGEENRSAAALTNGAAVVTPAPVNTETGKIFGTDTPALILDAAAVLFGVIDAGIIAATEPADEAETASEDAAPAEDVSSGQLGEQTKLSTEKSASASVTGQNRQSSVPAKSGTENNRGRDSAGRESSRTSGDGGKASATRGKRTDLTGEAEDGDRPPDTHAAETLSLSDSKL